MRATRRHVYSLLLADLRALFAGTGAAPLATTAILRHLIALEARPWAAYAGGQPLTPRQLATWLAGFQIRPKQIRQGAVTRKGYAPADFADAFRRYVPPDPTPRPVVPAAAPITGRGDGTPGGPGSDGEGLDSGATARRCFGCFASDGPGEGMAEDRQRTQVVQQGEFGSLTLNRLCAHAPSSLRPITCQLVVMPLVVAFQPAASSVLCASFGSTLPGSIGFQGAFSGSAFPVLSPCFPGFFADSTSSPKTLCFEPLASTTTPCFPGRHHLSRSAAPGDRVL